MIFITSSGEIFLLLFHCHFFCLVHFTIKKKKKKAVLQDCFCVPYLYCRITCPVGLNCDQMEEGEQYSEYPMERNPRAYMSMKDYINQPWQSQ